VHALVEGDDVQSLSRGMQGLGVSIAKRINRVGGRSGRVFDDRFFARALRTPREVANALNYVLRNDQIHEARMGFISDRTGKPDPFSSAALPRDAPLTSPPTTWLLTAGWRRAKPKALFGIIAAWPREPERASTRRRQARFIRASWRRSSSPAGVLLGPAFATG